ncbi:MAG: YdcF family protein [Proteobacteria bacterium]|jgi:uncharacterized SAM-binding protein YcdF (DUF218 family)|nr:YdcF family protein [Pseudomonadota bacterium]MCG6934779.1 YdcF family protein [Pseudomonadota bacterium]
MDILLTKVIQIFLLPPGNVILLMLLGYILARRFPFTGKFLVFSGFTLLVLLSTPLVANFNAGLLEGDRALTSKDLHYLNAQAIVILAGGRNIDAPEYGGQDTLSKATLERVRYGAWLQRQLHLPLLVTGGTVFASEHSGEAQLMRDTLQKDYGVPVRWVESESRNTWENARLSAAILKPAGVQRIYLVTTAFHMPRARMAFEANGLEVIPAPTGFMGQRGDAPLLMEFLPSIEALRNNYFVLHELLGIAWYKLRY